MMQNWNIETICMKAYTFFKLTYWSEKKRCAFFFVVVVVVFFGPLQKIFWAKCFETISLILLLLCRHEMGWHTGGIEEANKKYRGITDSWVKENKRSRSQVHQHVKCVHVFRWEQQQFTYAYLPRTQSNTKLNISEFERKYHRKQWHCHKTMVKFYNNNNVTANEHRTQTKGEKK